MTADEAQANAQAAADMEAARAQAHADLLAAEQAADALKKLTGGDQ
ncbi:hypothetical protein ACWGRL_04770 [[Kitasatospora] papulosa]